WGSFTTQASFGEQPLLERYDAGLLGHIRPVNDVVGEIILEIVAKGPHQPALRQVSGDERRSAERHAISRDGGLDHRRRVVDLQTPFAVDARKAGSLQP